METLLFSICLENSNYAEAEAAYKRLTSEFQDFNEIRVSSISELEPIFSGMSEPEVRAYYVRSVLQFIFEQNYAFDFESLRRNTLDQATKLLNKINPLSLFVKSFSLQNVLGSHLVPVDRRVLDATIWLGLAGPKADYKAAAAALKSGVKKNDVPLFAYLMRCLSCDPALIPLFDLEEYPPPKDGYNPNEVAGRLPELFIESTKKRRKKKVVKKVEKKKTAANKKTPQKKVKKKPAAKKTTAKKAAAKTKKPAATKKKTVKKKTVKRPTTKKTAKKKKKK